MLLLLHIYGVRRDIRREFAGGQDNATSREVLLLLLWSGTLVLLYEDVPGRVTQMLLLVYQHLLLRDAAHA